MKKTLLLLLVTPFFFGGCGRNKNIREGEMSETIQDFNIQTGNYVAEVIRGEFPDAENLEVITQQEMGVMTRKDLQLILQGLQDTWGEVKVVEVEFDELVPGMGLPAELYDSVANQQGDADLVISLVGVPMGEKQLSGSARTTPLVALLEPMVTNEVLNDRTVLPGRWLLLRRQPEVSGPPQDSFERFSSTR